MAGKVRLVVRVHYKQINSLSFGGKDKSMTSPPEGKFSVKSTSEDITEIYFQIHIYPPTFSFLWLQTGCEIGFGRSKRTRTIEIHQCNRAKELLMSTRRYIYIYSAPPPPQYNM